MAKRKGTKGYAVNAYLAILAFFILSTMVEACSPGKYQYYDYYYDRYDCRDCLSGEYSSNGVSCSDCPIGKYSGR